MARDENTPPPDLNKPAAPASPPPIVVPPPPTRAELPPPPPQDQPEAEPELTDLEKFAEAVNEAGSVEALVRRLKAELRHAIVDIKHGCPGAVGDTLVRYMALAGCSVEASPRMPALFGSRGRCTQDNVFSIIFCMIDDALRGIWYVATDDAEEYVRTCKVLADLADIGHTGLSSFKTTGNLKDGFRLVRKGA